MRRAVLTTVLLGALVTPPAAADPGPLPDLSGYTAADPAAYGKHYNYPATYGIQFATPAGYRCRITFTWKANPSVKDASCWGDLPGTTSNAVFVRAASSPTPAPQPAPLPML